VPYCNCQCQTSLVGACTHCWIRGITVQTPGGKTKATLWYAALSRCTEEQQRKLLPELKKSFRHAPKNLQDAVMRLVAPRPKNHLDNQRRGKAAEEDKHCLPEGATHASRDKRNGGFHRRDVLSSDAYSGEWDSSKQFMNCTSHAVMNVMKDLFELIGAVGNMAFSRKRRGLEAYLGRLEYIGGDAKARWDVEQANKEEAARGKGVARNELAETYSEDGEYHDGDDETTGMIVSK
jgi:hypothetical protein